CCSVALLNVVIRRANASLIEEQINAVVTTWRRFTPVLLERTPCASAAFNPPATQIYPTPTWPDGRISVTVSPNGTNLPTPPDTGLEKASDAGIVNDRGRLEFRAAGAVARPECSVSVIVQIPLTGSLLEALSGEVGLEVSATRTELMQHYRAERGFLGEIEA